MGGGGGELRRGGGKRGQALSGYGVKVCLKTLLHYFMQPMAT